MKPIERYFDKQLDARERDKLEGEILTTPEHAREFALAARLDFSLESILTEDTDAQELDRIISLIQSEPKPAKISQRLLVMTSA
jgi:hypothetical protein